MRVLFYCQHLLGVGHLTRSLALCEALAGSFKVDLIHGGPDIGIKSELTSGHLRCLQIPPLLMRETDESLYDPSGDRMPTEVFSARKRAMTRLVRGCYDHFLVDLFPFGRRKFRHEIVWLIERLRRANPGIRIHCSLRDVMVDRKEARQQETISYIQRFFDTVLVHSDPRFIRLDETFGRIQEIGSKIVYTGFVVRRQAVTKRRTRHARILVSMGGGVVGGELAEAAVSLASRLPAYEFRVVLGPHTPESVRSSLVAKARKHSNVRVRRFMRNFQSALSTCRLSVSLAGYNTIMDLLRTKTPAVVFPYAANREQELRARRFEAAGLLAVGSDLRRRPFEALLRRELNRSYPQVLVDLDGADRTRDFLLEGRLKCPSPLSATAAITPADGSL